MELIDGSKIGALINRATNDFGVRLRLFHCPDKLLQEDDYSPEEAPAIRLGDLSRVDLDEETLTLGRRYFSEIPVPDDAEPGAGNNYLAEFRSAEVRSLCL